MSFLKRFAFKRFKSAQQETAPSTSSKKERASRLRILPLHRVRFVKSEQAGSDSILVSNLSTSGIGFIRGSAVSWPRLGDRIEGTLNIEGQEIRIHARVAHISEFIVGCSFDETPPELGSILSHFFAPELAASKLHQVPSDLLQPVPGGRPFCFLGENNCELYYILKGERVAYFELTFYGNYFEAALGQAVIFGFVDSGEQVEQPKHKGANLVRSGGKPSKEVALAAIRFVENIEKAAPEARSSICSMLSSQLT